MKYYSNMIMDILAIMKHVTSTHQRLSCIESHVTGQVMESSRSVAEVIKITTINCTQGCKDEAWDFYLMYNNLQIQSKISCLTQTNARNSLPMSKNLAT